ncbi:alkaline-phosphatase-like protein [Aspergillus granulosus]|uniref:Alkaline-phosphatase-like protein n=1 Tax=Aspergillus granulosus TaxID=176169 RepID=A0ABR4H1T4_9EURO
MKINSLVALVEAAALIWAAPSQCSPPNKPGHKSGPNFIFVLTDDQDLTMDSTEYMPHVRDRIRQKGIDFSNHFVTTALCCPSRVSLFTGRQAHNTNVTDVDPPYGGYPKFVSQGLNDDWLPVWLQESGYNTYYVGKLFNGHSVETYNKPFVKGFNGSEFLLEPYTYSYWNSVYQRNHEPPKSYAGRYTTDVTIEKALGFLDDALEDNNNRPFFITIAPIAPHFEKQPDAADGEPLYPPVPAPRHAHLFPDAKVPRVPSFNPVNHTGPSWVKGMELQNKSQVDYADFFYRQRLRSLQGVDELVDQLLNRLENSGQLENTYVIYSSDNGFHIGQHRLPPGKTTSYEEDIRVPFFVRGPGIKPRQETQVTTHIDFAATIFELAGLPLRDDFDGTPMKFRKMSVAVPHEHVIVEYWGDAVLEGIYGINPADNTNRLANNTYKSTRIVSKSHNLFYAVWCTGDHELYDLNDDPYQMHNIYTKASQNLLDRLDGLLLVLKSCGGRTCIEPWKQLHPDGSVRTLSEALNPKYDLFYDGLPKVEYDYCVKGHVVAAEGPQWEDVEVRV